MNHIVQDIESALVSVVQLAYSTGVTVLPWIAAASSIISALSPWPIISQIKMAKRTLTYTFSPYFFFTLQSFIFLLYSYSASNPILGFTCSIGFVLGMYYISVFYCYTNDKTTPKVLLGAASFVAFALTMEVMIRSLNESEVMVGMAGNIVIMLTAASEFAEVRRVMVHRDASCLSFDLSMTNTITSFIWTFYGLKLDDFVVIFSNAVSFIMGIIQLSLIFLYTKKNNIHIKHKFIRIQRSMSKGPIVDHRILV